MGECLKDETISNHLKNCQEEIVASLDMNKDEALSYANDVMTRFANPYIKHMCQSIALNSVSKFKVRVLPSILEYEKKFGYAPKTLLFSFAKLIDFYRTDMTDDDKEITEFMKTASVKEILANEKLWGEDLSYLENEVLKYADK